MDVMKVTTFTMRLKYILDQHFKMYYIKRTLKTKQPYLHVFICIRYS